MKAELSYIRHLLGGRVASCPYRIDVAVREAAIGSGDTEALWELGSRAVYDLEIREATLACLPIGDNRWSIAAGRVAAAGGWGMPGAAAR